MKIAVVPNLTRERALEVTAAACRELKALGAEVFFENELRQSLSGLDGVGFSEPERLFESCDFIISVGGDGSVMRAAKIAAKYRKKILGINAGRLAYLCGLDADETGLLSRLLTGEYFVCRRMMLRAELIRDGKNVMSENCLNDVVFGRGTDIALCEVSVCADGRPTADYIADGVIIATPTGSTAYSMSAGGPILEPTLEAVLVTPICPHSLVSRPYIFSSDVVFDIRCTPVKAGANTGFSCDGGETVPLKKGDIVTIRKSDAFVDLISIKPDNFVDVLNRKTELKK